MDAAKADTADLAKEKIEVVLSGGPRPLMEPSDHSLTGILLVKIPPVSPGY